MDDEVLTGVTPEVGCIMRTALPDEPLRSQHPLDWRMTRRRMRVTSCVITSHWQPLQHQGLQPARSSGPIRLGCTLFYVIAASAATIKGQYR